MVKSREEILAEFKLLDTINDCKSIPNSQVNSNRLK